MTTTRPSRRPARLLAGTAVVALALVSTGAAAANAKGGDVRRSGSCSVASTWKLKAKPDNAALQVEFEVDQNKVGQTWSVAITDNGASIFSGTRTTTAPSGSFTVAVRTANRAGADQIVAKATNAATGETCRGALTI